MLSLCCLRSYQLITTCHNKLFFPLGFIWDKGRGGPPLIGGKLSHQVACTNGWIHEVVWLSKAKSLFSMQMLLHSTKVLAPCIAVANFWGLASPTHPQCALINTCWWRSWRSIWLLIMRCLHTPNILLMAGITQHINPMSIPLNPITYYMGKYFITRCSSIMYHLCLSCATCAW